MHSEIGSCGRQREREVAGSGGDIADYATRRYGPGGRRDQALLPSPIHSEREDAGKPVVARGDEVKHRRHELLPPCRIAQVLFEIELSKAAGMIAWHGMELTGKATGVE
jgi:hypothetical protein